MCFNLAYITQSLDAGHVLQLTVDWLQPKAEGFTKRCLQILYLILDLLERCMWEFWTKVSGQYRRPNNLHASRGT